MIPLTQQLEDKKKELDKLREEHICFTGVYPESCERFQCADRDNALILKAEIAILEQAIAEKKKRDEEVDNAIDFLSSYPIWTNIIDKEGNKQEIPEELYPILDNFIKMIKKVLKEQLNSQRENTRIDGTNLEEDTADTPQKKVSEVQFKALFPDIEKSPVVSNLLQKQRQEEIDFLNKIYEISEGAEGNIAFRIAELEQLNQPKTEK